MRARPRTRGVAGLVWWLVPVLVPWVACFKHPVDKVSGMVCQDDNQCPTGYQCWLLPEKGGRCHGAVETSGAGGASVTGSGESQGGGQPDSASDQGGAGGNTGTDAGGIVTGGSVGGGGAHTDGMAGTTLGAGGVSVASGGLGGQTVSVPGSTGGQTSTGGSAGNTCPVAGQTLCGTTCVDTQKDDHNCGRCDSQCSAGQHCSVGSCVCDATSCTNGCCSGSSCIAVSAQGNDKCGTAGVACETCKGGSTCAEGTCTCPTGQTSCDGECADLQTTTNHCGICTNQCKDSNAGCSAGRCYRTINSKIGNSSFASRIAVNATDIYVTQTSDGTVSRVSRKDGTVQVLATTQPYPTGIALDANNLYWANGGNGVTLGSIMKMPLGGAVPVPLASGEPYPLDLAVDGTNVYWSNFDYVGSIKKVPIAGGDVVTLASGASLVNTYGMTIDSTSAYWANMGDGDYTGNVMKVLLSGGTPAVIGSSVDTPTNIAVLGNTVFFGCSGIKAMGLKKVSTAGGAVSSVMDAWTAQTYPIIADASAVYLGGGGPKHDQIVRLAASDNWTPKTLATGIPTALAVDDNNLYWTALNVGLAVTPKVP